MNHSLDKTLRAIGEDYAEKISPTSRLYVEVDIGEKATQLGFSATAKRYRKVLAVVPVKQAENGMKVRIDGRTFINYSQLKSGVVIPGHVIKNSTLSHDQYLPRESMVLNFT